MPWSPSDSDPACAISITTRRRPSPASTGARIAAARERRQRARSAAAAQRASTPQPITASRIPISASESTGRGAGTGEDVLVAAAAGAARGQALELEATAAEEAEHVVGLRDLEGISTDPLDHVSPAAHAPLAAVVRPRAADDLRPAARDRAQEREELVRRHHENREPDARVLRQPVVDPLHVPPEPAHPLLVVVDRD